VESLHGQNVRGIATSGSVELDELAAAYFTASNVGVCILDPGLRYIAINRTLADMNGVPAEDHLGRTVREILGELADPMEKKFSEVLQIRRPLGFEVSGKLPSRKESSHWIAHYLPILNEQGTVSRVGAVVIEVTAPRVLEESVQKLDKQLRQETNRLQMGCHLIDQFYIIGPECTRASAPQNHNS